MTMSIGMNTNIKFQGKVYHAQTEDGGKDNPIITTLLFKDGVVFASKRSDYSDLLGTPSYRETVVEMMKEQHKTILRELVAGKIKGVETAGQNMTEAIGPLEQQDRPSEGKSQHGAASTDDSVEKLDALIAEYLVEKNKSID